MDFYSESELLWLEADALIRRETKGRKSLDDFCRLFHGGHSGSPKVVPYTFDDLVAALNQVAPHDWRAFWVSRLESPTEKAPLAGIEAAGWRVVYKDTPSAWQKSAEEARKITDVRSALGFIVDEHGRIPDVLPDSPAEKAGIGPGMQLVAVNGRKWSRDTLRDAIRATKSGQPLELLVENGEFYRTYPMNYSAGERYAHLERDPGKPDLLSQIIQAKARNP